jgi:hypothetical protein
VRLCSCFLVVFLAHNPFNTSALYVWVCSWAFSLVWAARKKEGGGGDVCTGVGAWGVLSLWVTSLGAVRDTLGVSHLCPTQGGTDLKLCDDCLSGLCSRRVRRERGPGVQGCMDMWKGGGLGVLVMLGTP